MNLTQLIKNMKNKGIMSVAPIKIIGRAKPTLEMLAIMADTEPEETDPNWWVIRLWIIRN